MITVSIGGMSVPIERASEGWINQMIVDARKRGALVCIQVGIDVPGAQFSLSTQGCRRGSSGGWQPNTVETRIIAAWNRRGLNEVDIHPGNLRAFLSDLGRLT